MKRTMLFSATILLLASGFRATAGIIAGPITNPANGHDYYLLAPDGWIASEAEAENLGGTLAVIRSAAEQEWVFSKFGSYGGTSRDLWIGLHRKAYGGPFSWPAEESVDYTNWYPGEPNNVNGTENCVHMRAGTDRPGTWNDLLDNNSFCAVVEVPGKSNPESLTKQERALVGTWYHSGRVDQPCRIAATDNMLFTINENLNTSRTIHTKDGLLFSSVWRIYGEIAGDKILWSNGTWWSRTPTKFSDGKKIEITPD